MTLLVTSRRSDGARTPEGVRAVYIGRPSPLGNPFRVGRDGTREEVVKLFHGYLEKIVRSPDADRKADWLEVRNELRRIKKLEQRLGTVALECWCAPEPCHGEVIAKFVTNISEPPPTLLVAGSRTFRDHAKVREIVTALAKETPELTIVSGMARGADLLGAKVAEELGLKLIRVPARWDKYGRRAGYLRNEVLVDLADRVLVFWDGKSRGTAHTLGLCEKAGIPVRLERF